MLTVPILALLGLFGERTALAGARSATLDVAVSYPERFRYRQVQPLTLAECLPEVLPVERVVANKHLACGTQVALRYRGRTLVVPVIDRGPYSRGVDFDLTYATARKLGMRQTSRLSAAALHS